MQFILETTPHYIPVEDRYCRACDQSTNHVLSAVDTNYQFPCCVSLDCQAIVQGQILAALPRSKSSTSTVQERSQKRSLWRRIRLEVRLLLRAYARYLRNKEEFRREYPGLYDLKDESWS